MKRFVILGIVVSAALGFLLFSGTQDFSDRQHADFQTALWRLKQLDATFKENLLKARFSLLNTYDDFESNWRDSQDTLTAIAAIPDFVRVARREDLQKTLDEYRRLLNARHDMVEQFKSRNAVVTNSRRYLPLGFEQLGQRSATGAADRELAHAVTRLSRSLLATLSGTEMTADEVAADLEPLRAWIARNPAHAAARIAASVEAHARSLVVANPRLDALTNQILGVPTTEQVERMLHLYETEVTAALVRSRQYRGGLYILGALLLAAIAGGFVALRGANRQLERRVEDRTRALAGSEGRFRTLAAAAPIGIFLTDARGQSLYTNPYWQAIGGLSLEESLGDGWRRAVHPEDADGVSAEWIRKAAEGQSFDRRLRFRTRAGEVRWVHVRTASVRTESGEITGHVGTVENITEHLDAERQLAEANRRLVDTSRQAGMTEVATNVLHNVGNVLNSVNVSANLAAEMVNKPRTTGLAKVVALLGDHANDLGRFMTQDPRGRQVPNYLAQLLGQLQSDQQATSAELDSLRTNIDHIKEIVAMQQSYAVVSGVKEHVDVRGLVEDSVRMNLGAFARHGVEISREFEDVPPVNVDKHKVLQILVNLIRNAKYACDEGGRTDKNVRVRVARHDGHVVVSVIDDGVGIPKENMPKLFRHGFTTRKAGHGFGLHSGALAAREIGGRLSAHSDGPGRGATFTLEVPIETQETAHA